MEDESKSLILIVDDNPHNIQVLGAVISEGEYIPGFAMNGQQALDFLEENKPDLILLDIMMPEMDGFEVCKKIKSNENLVDIPIIFLTAKSEKEDIIKGFKLGAVDYITKPFNNEELKMRIKTHIELVQNRKKLKLLNEKLEKSNATKDKFFSLIAHDLRGPIGNINQYIDLIMYDINESELDSLSQDFKILKSISKTSYDLLESLLVWASSQKGEIEYKPKLNNFYDLIEFNFNLFRQIAEKKQINLINEVSKDLEFLYDYNMINTVIRNLINNALKYTDIEGDIKVNSEVMDKNIKITVSDTGLGINKATLDSLFKIDVKTFSQEGTQGEKGSGLGLTICKEFIDKHNGEIWVDSELGKGSKFQFTIPKILK